MQCDESIRRMINNPPESTPERYTPHENNKIEYLFISKPESPWRRINPWAFVIGFCLVVGLLEGLIGR